MSLSVVEKEVNQLRLTLKPYRTTVSGVGYNRIMTSFFMVPTRVAVQTSVPLAPSAGPHHSISTGILVAIVVPAAVVAFIIIPFLYLLYRRRVRRRRRAGVYEDPIPAPVRLSDDSRSPDTAAPVITPWSSTTPATAPTTEFSRNEKLFLALGDDAQSRNPDIMSAAGVATSPSPPRRSSTQRSRSTRSTTKASYTAPQVPPEYHVANARYSLSTDSHYTGTLVTRRPSQRRLEFVYPTVPVFLDYIGTLPGAERRNIAQYAPTFLAQDYYTLDELRDLTQAQLCEAIPGLTRGNADYICQMVAQELERIESAGYTYGTAF